MNPHYSFQSGNINNQYEGEYTIVGNDLPWAAYRLNSVLAPLIGVDLFVTSQIELVSFPFVAECVYENTQGCYLTPTRTLTMPIEGSYNSFLEAWQFPLANNPELYNITLERPLELNTLGDFLSDQTNPYTINTSGFNGTGSANPSRIILPHSVLKHTIRLRCGAPNSNGTLISSIIFYVDLTRGIMREYPFTPTNSGTNAVLHDVTVKPGIAGNAYWDYSATNICSYGETYVGLNCSTAVDWKGNTINYTPFNLDADDNICSSVIPLTSTVQNDWDGYIAGSSSTMSNLNHLPIANYTLIASTGVRDIESIYPAGYVLTGTGFQRISSAPFPHQYFIDKEIDLEEINFEDKVIFNPSEVHITAPLLRFPSNYTFKTIRGTYPYLPDVIAENTLENGGPYNDSDPYDPNYISNLNVTTDLGKDWNVVGSYTPNDPKSSSIYHLDAPSKLIVEPCVRIFDATFEVNAGSEIVFENWSTNQINVDRYKLLYEGGTVTKCDYEILMQSENEDRKILQFKAGNSLRAGENIDINDPSGVYKIFDGAEVVFVANNYISLESGFDSESGAFLDAKIEYVEIPACDPLRIGRKDDGKPPVNYNKEAISYFECSPNPITANSVCMFKIGSTSNITLKVYNSLGQLIATICEEKQLPAGSNSYNLNKTEFMSGIYYAKLVVNSDSKSLKFIKP